MQTQMLSAAEIIVHKLQNWLYAIIEMLPNLVLAGIVIAVFLYVSRFTHKLFSKVADRISTHRAINGFLGTVIHIGVLCVGIFIALGLLKLDKTVVSLLAGAGILGLALSFAFQDTAANFIAGIILAIRHPINVGDLIKVKEFLGTVERINLRSTYLHTLQGQLVIIPNKDVLQNPLQNYTYTGSRSIEIPLSVSISEDIEKVRDITIHAIKQLPHLQQNQEVELYFEELGKDSISFTVRYWIHSLSQAQYQRALSDGILAIKKAYHRNGFLPPQSNKTDETAEVLSNENIEAAEELSELIIKAEIPKNAIS